MPSGIKMTLFCTRGLFLCLLAPLKVRAKKSYLYFLTRNSLFFTFLASHHLLEYNVEYMRYFVLLWVAFILPAICKHASKCIHILNPQVALKKLPIYFLLSLITDSVLCLARPVLLLFKECGLLTSWVAEQTGREWKNSLSN